MDNQIKKVYIMRDNETGWYVKSFRSGDFTEDIKEAYKWDNPEDADTDLCFAFLGAEELEIIEASTLNQTK